MAEGTNQLESRESPDGAPALDPPRGLSRDLWLVFAVALALRLLHLWCIRDMPFVETPIVDAKAYDEWGQRIAAGDWWGSEVFYQAPLYPYFLGLLYAVFGHDLVLVHVAQMAMGAAACVLLALAAFALFADRATALCTGLCMAVYPPAIFFDGLIGKPGLGLLLTSALLWVLLRQQNVLRPWELAGAGALLGLLCLTRENALALVPAVGLWIVWRFRALGPARAARAGAVFALGLAAVLLPVGLRNLAVGDTFALTTSQMGPNFYIGNNPEATGLYAPLLPGRQTPVYEASDAELLAERALGRELTRGEVSDYWLERGLAFVREEPGAWLGLLARKTLLTWGAFEVPDVEDIYVYGDWSPIVRFGLPALHFGWVAAWAAAGAVFAWPRRRDWALIAWLALVYTASVALFMTFARFRYPLVPLLMPLVGLGVARAGRAVASRTWGELLAPATAFVLVFAFTGIELIDAEAMKVTSYTNLGGIMLEAKRLDEAEGYLARALEARPENADLQLHMAVLRHEQGREDDALRHLAEMRRLAPDDFRSWVLQARVLEAQGRPEQARRARQRARALDPDGPARARAGAGGERAPAAPAAREPGSAR